MARTKRSRKMREGECRTTKNGQEYCKRDGVVRFEGSGRKPRRRTKTTRKRRPTTRKRRPRRALGGAGVGNLGMTCQRFKRVPIKGKRGTARRCAKMG